MRFRDPVLIMLTMLAASGCASPSVHDAIETPPPAWSANTSRLDNPPLAARPAANPRIVKGASGLQCVPYARRHSGIYIRGDAWTWWSQAKGKYHRASIPVVGSVLVVDRTGKNRYGHLAVVTRIVNEREIIVDHANGLNRGRIHLDTPVRDVSPRNDWSAVRFWYTPANVLGKTTYPVRGFIYPAKVTASSG